MPGLNQKGPQGQGPGTGRKMGICQNGNNQTERPFGQESYGMGRGLRRGRGMGSGGGRGRMGNGRNKFGNNGGSI